MQVGIHIVFAAMIAAGTLQSMRQTARENGGVAANSMNFFQPVTELSDVVEQSDFIVQGRIIGSRTLLIMDDQWVATEYAVHPSRVLKLNPALSVAPQPGFQPSAAVVRRLGGTLNEGGAQYPTTNTSLREADAPRIGDEVIWFLRYDANEKVFNLTAGAFAAFRIAQGKVHPQTNAVATRRGDRPVDLSAFLQDVQDRISRSRR